MTRDEILQFVRRDRSAVDAVKTRFWHDLKTRLSAAEVLGMADQLRQEARRLRPDWPSHDERLQDIAVHRRVSEGLRAVTLRSR